MPKINGKKICYFTQILKYTKFVKPKFLDS